eukprot:1595428-Rhodomonas_salina.2
MPALVALPGRSGRSKSHGRAMGAMVVARIADCSVPAVLLMYQKYGLKIRISTKVVPSEAASPGTNYYRVREEKCLQLEARDAPAGSATTLYRRRLQLPSGTGSGP